MHVQFPDVFFKDLVQGSSDQQQQQPKATCIVGSHLMLDQFDSWAVTFQTMTLANGFASDNNAYGVIATNTTFWYGPYGPHAEPVINKSIELSQNSAELTSCMELENEAKFPPMMLYENGTTEQQTTAERSVGSVGVENGTQSSPVDTAVAPVANGAEDATPVVILPPAEDSGGGGRGGNNWVTPVVIVICISALLFLFAVDFAAPVCIFLLQLKASLM